MKRKTMQAIADVLAEHDNKIDLAAETKINAILRDEAKKSISSHYKNPVLIEQLCNTTRMMPERMVDRLEMWKHYAKLYKKQSIEAADHIDFLYRTLDRAALLNETAIENLDI